MLFCNVCGAPKPFLEKSHTLNKEGLRTGSVLMTCHGCHIKYHAERKDFSAWGKKGALLKARRKFSKWCR